MKTVLRSFILLILLTLATVCAAVDTYILSGSGGTAVNTDSSTSSYGLNGYQYWEGGGYGYLTASDFVGASGTCSAGGAVSLTLAWHSDEGHPAPTKALVQVSSEAYTTQINIAGDIHYANWSGDASSGLGKEYEIAYVGPTSAWAEGTRYLLTPGGSTITIPALTPTVHNTVSLAKISQNQCYMSSTARVGVQAYYNLSDLHVSVSVGWASNLTSRVAGLTYNTDRHRQEAAFSVSASATLDGQTLPTGSGYTVQYQWSESNGNLEYNDVTAPTGTAYATGPCVSFPTCIVVLLHNGVPVATGYNSAECAAIGGPLTISVVGPTQHITTSVAYQHDKNDPTKSWYLTYFNDAVFISYSRNSNGDLVPSIVGPKYDEALQYASVKSQAQPSGTTAVRDAIPNTTSSFVGTSFLQGVICAKGAFKDEPIRVHFVFHDGAISNDGSYYTSKGQPAVDIVDDTAQSMNPIKDDKGNVVGYTPLLVNTLSGHKPGSLVEATSSIDPQLDSANNPIPLSSQEHQGATYWTDKMLYRYILHDTDGDPMPGVYVQERFINGSPPGFRVNDASEYWPTLLNTTLDSKIIDPSDGLFMSSKVGGVYGGVGLIYDSLRYVWASGDTGTKMLDHAYFAGTFDPTSSARTGADLGVYTITFTQGSPGTASQSQTSTTTPPPPGH